MTPRSADRLIASCAEVSTDVKYLPAHFLLASGESSGPVQDLVPLPTVPYRFFMTVMQAWERQ